MPPCLHIAQARCARQGIVQHLEACASNACRLTTRERMPWLDCLLFTTARAQAAPRANLLTSGCVPLKQRTGSPHEHLVGIDVDVGMSACALRQQPDQDDRPRTGISLAPCPLPLAPCPLPFALCPLPFALCPLPFALCTLHFSPEQAKATSCSQQTAGKATDGAYFRPPVAGEAASGRTIIFTFCAAACHCAVVDANFWPPQYEKPCHASRLCAFCSVDVRQ